MNDTVTKLLYLADDFAAAAHNYFVNTNSKPKWEKMVSERQALQDELVRLFTPLTDEHVDDLFAAVVDKVNAGEIAYESVGLARAVEAAHGITGEKNEVA